MLCYRGFLIGLNPDTKKMLPFFLKVRSEDIVMTDPILPASVLTQISTRWTLRETRDAVDQTFTRYEGAWESSVDPNAEVVGSEYCDSFLEYHIFKDGRLEITGVLKATGTVDAGSSVTKIAKSVYLPFALPTKADGSVNGYMQFGYGAGLCRDLSLSGFISNHIVTNQSLNLGGVDTTAYPCEVTVNQTTPTSVTEWIDVPATSADYDTFIRRDFPIEFKFIGFWK